MRLEELYESAIGGFPPEQERLYGYDPETVLHSQRLIGWVSVSSFIDSPAEVVALLLPLAGSGRSSCSNISV
jgi:hypothetical protein